MEKEQEQQHVKGMGKCMSKDTLALPHDTTLTLPMQNNPAFGDWSNRKNNEIP